MLHKLISIFKRYILIHVASSSSSSFLHRVLITYLFSFLFYIYSFLPPPTHTLLFFFQKANSDSSVYEARAIAAKGKAEAEVLAAMYKAKAQNKEVYMAEVQRDIAKSIYGNLKDFKVEMPHNYIGGGGNSGHLTSNLDVITGLAALGLMEKSGQASGGLGSFFPGSAKKQ
jgi:hypothetical protein